MKHTCVECEEEWRPIKGYEGLYEISNYGQVRSLDRLVNSHKGERLHKGKLLSIYVNRYGYCKIGLRLGYDRKEYHVHRLVYETFVAPIPDKLTINHKDENKTNNCIWNLEVMTRGENTNYGTRNQRASEARSIVVCCLDKNYRLIKKYKGYHEYEAEGFDKHSVGRCCMGKLDYYKGYLWLYENDYYKLCKGEAEEIMTARKKMREEYLIWQRNSKNRYYHTVLKNSSKYKQRVKEICAKRRKIHA